MPPLLLELGTEEIPASYLEPALAQMQSAFDEACRELTLECGKVETLATPRRLVLGCASLPDRQADALEEALGPSEKAAYDASGQPTKALIGFAKSKGVDVSEVVLKDTPKGRYCMVSIHRPGKTILEILPAILTRVVAAASFPKSMRWGVPNCSFARPIRSILALCGTEVVPFTCAGIEAGQHTLGHPFLDPAPIEIPSADLTEFKKTLRRASVVLSVRERKDLIALKVNHILKQYGSELDDVDLLGEVTNLVEFPNALECSFPEEYLALPDAVLEAAMKGHQRYFPVRDKGGKMLSRFVVVSNRADTHSPDIREGNERVLRARLSDAKFFWDADGKRPLTSLRDGLRGISYLGKLGSMLDRSERLRVLAAAMAKRLGEDASVVATVERAASLCKADLLTEMVGEFPELQGIMGGEYARVQGEPEPVCIAIREHYMPRSTHDEVPDSSAGVALALAEKVDHLVACFAIGQRPSGSADPYGLRRAAIGLIRIVNENALKLSLKQDCSQALALLPPECRQKADTIPAVLEFIRDRLFQMCVDSKVPHDLVRALLSAGYDDLTDFRHRMEAMMKCAKMPTWPSLVTIVERTYNISKAHPADDKGAVDAALLKEPQEQALWKVWTENQPSIAKLIEMGKYEQAAVAYNRIFADPVHAFFDKVFVNVEDAAVKTNRMRILRAIHRLFAEHVADLALIQLGATIGAAGAEKKAADKAGGDELTALGKD